MGEHLQFLAYKTLLPIFLAIPFYPLFIIFILVIALPFRLWSKFVNYLAKFVDPDLGKMLTGLDASQIRDIDLIHTEPSAVLAVCARFSGSLNMSQIISEFEERVVLKMDSSAPRPTLFYPELQQYPIKFMGYAFLKKDKQFNLKNHFHRYTEKEKVTRDDIQQIWETLMSKPFEKHRSPWQFILIDNYIPDERERKMWKLQDTDNCWIALMRVHHSLADGVSIQNMIGLMASNPLKIDIPIKLSSLQRFMLNARACTLGPYDLMRGLLNVDSYHALHIPFKKQARQCFLIEGEIHACTRVTKLKENFGVGFTIILVSLISGGLRKYLIKYKKPIPKVISAAIPFATGDHSDKFTNDFSLTSVTYPVQINDPVQRVNYVRKEFQALLSTSWMKMSDFIIDVCGSFPIGMYRGLTEKQFFCSTYSTMPGPKQITKSFANSFLREVEFSNGRGPDSASFGISTITYNGHFRYILFIDKNVVDSREAAEDIIRFIDEEFSVLENCEMENSKRK